MRFEYQSLQIKSHCMVSIHTHTHTLYEWPIANEREWVSEWVKAKERARWRSKWMSEKVTPIYTIPKSINSASNVFPHRNQMHEIFSFLCNSNWDGYVREIAEHQEMKTNAYWNNNNNMLYGVDGGLRFVHLTVTLASSGYLCSICAQRLLLS